MSMTDWDDKTMFWNKPEKGYIRTLLILFIHATIGVAGFAPTNRKMILAPIIIPTTELRMLRRVSNMLRVVIIPFKYSSEIKDPNINNARIM